MKNSASFSNSELKSPLATIMTTALVILAGCLAIYQATMGLQVVSTEDGRRLDIAQHPRTVPDAILDWPARPQFADVLRSDGRVTVVAFIYTSCNAVCTVLSSEFEQMQTAIRTRGLQDKVRLLSISFDPRDDQQRLAAYATRQHADKHIWQFAGISDGAERQAVLDTFGVVVVPAPLGEFVHNAAFHLVGRSGLLTKIVDYDAPERALADALAMYDEKEK